MKSFFKKLSLVLAAAMVITMLPAQIAKAAPTALKIAEESKKAEAVVSPTYNLKVNDTIDLTFVGATGYDAAAAATKKWSSKDTKVATVDKNGVVKALKAGQTVITITCTAKGVEYQGTATVNVSDSTVEVKQTKYNEVAVIFATEGDATSAKANIKAYLVQRAANGNTRLRDARPTVAIDGTNKNVVNVSGLVDGLEYQIAVPGVATNYTVNMKVGEPYEVTLYYPVAYVAKGKNITGTDITTQVANPVVEVLDVNGIVVNFDASKLTYKALEKKGNANLATSASAQKAKGAVTFTNGNAESEMKVQVTYKFTDSAKKEQSLTAVAYAQADAYTAPSLGGWAESIVATDKKAENIVYDDNYSITLNVNESKYLAYYFLGADGKKYTGSNVSGTASSAKSGKEVFVINNSEYIFYFEKDTDDTVVSLTDADAQQKGLTKITGWKKGEQDISLYRVKGKKINERDSKVDTYLGTIHVSVNEEAVIDDIILDDNTITGWHNAYGDAVKGELKFTLQDQYQKGNKTPISYTAQGVQAGGITIENPTKDDGVGKIKFDFSKIDKTDADKPIVVTLYAPYTNVKTELSVYSFDVDTSVDPDYALVVDAKNAKINNNAFLNDTNVHALGLDIKIAQSFNGALNGYAPFWMVSDNFTNDSTCTKANNDFLVVVYNSNDVPVAADKSGNNILLSTSTAASATKVSGFNFDLFADTATSVADGLMAPGTYKVVAYYVADGYVDTLGEPVYVELANNMELLQNIHTGKVLDKDSNNKVKVSDTNIDFNTVGTYGVALVKKIVGQLQAFYDLNSNGTVEAGEIGSIETLIGTNFTIDEAQSKYYDGSDGSETTSKELYIKYVTIKFKTKSLKEVEQRITVEKKFKITAPSN